MNKDMRGRAIKLVGNVDCCLRSLSVMSNTYLGVTICDEGDWYHFSQSSKRLSLTVRRATVPADEGMMKSGTMDSTLFSYNVCDYNDDFRKRGRC
jgi:hypothetical protein